MLKYLLCLISGHKWWGYSDLALCTCERCGKELRGRPARKAMNLPYFT